MRARPAVEIQARRIDPGVIAGHAVDLERPELSLTLEAWLDGAIAGATVADLYCWELASLGLATPRHGFLFSFDAATLEQARLLEIRVANRWDWLGQTVDLTKITRPFDDVAGAVDWCGGLRFSGWVNDDGEETPSVGAYIDERLVAETHANRWRHIDPPESRPRRGFDLHLPARFADGQVWSVQVRADDGRELAGSPATFWAFADGLEATLAGLAAAPGQRLRGAHFDRVLPNALPFAAYADVRSAYIPAAPSRAASKSWGVVILDGAGLQGALESLDAQSVNDWTCVALAAQHEPFTFDPGELGDFVASHAGTAQWFLFLLAGAQLGPDALRRFDAAAEAHPDVRLIYADREIETEDGVVWPLALPAFDYERMLEQGYFAPLFALSRASVETACAARVDNWFGLALVVADPARALHLPGPAARHAPEILAAAGPVLRDATAAHLAALGMIAEVETQRSAGFATCRVRRRYPQKPSVTILVPTRDRVDMLSDCLESIFNGAAAARAEILVIDNESREPRTRHYLNELGRRGVRILPAPGPFNFARLNNLAAAEARGEFLCFLNNDVKASDDQWLEEMLSRHADATVGVVGAKLLWPSGLVQHGGVTLGVNFAPAHAFRDCLDAEPGYGGQLLCAHETGAVTAACMTTRRELFLELGGFDALRFAIDFNDVDYCLRVSAKGYRVVFTPHAKLQHLESASRGRDASPHFQRELRSLRNIWGEALVADPSYSPLLALSDPPYAALASPPRSLEPRRRLTPPPRRPPPGF